MADALAAQALEIDLADLGAVETVIACAEALSGAVDGTQLSDSALQDPRTATLAEKFTMLLPALTPDELAAAVIGKLASSRPTATMTLPRLGSPLVGIRQIPLRVVDPVFRGALR